jgi:L-threonylcarbamoyladenylate synthase
MLKWHCSKDVTALKRFLIENKLFIGSTDTVLGLMCKVDVSAKRIIDNVKIRSGKPYVILVDSMEKVSKLCVINQTLTTFLTACWPGPVTVILPVSQDAPEWMKELETVAIRIPDHKGLQSVLSNLPFGLYSTSANISGEPVPRSFNEVAQQIKDACVCYIDDETGCNDVPSTIIDCTQDSFRVIRSGAYPIERLQELYNRASD